jgi:hypothetical protein
MEVDIVAGIIQKVYTRTTIPEEEIESVAVCRHAIGPGVICTVEGTGISTCVRIGTDGLVESGWIASLSAKQKSVDS